MADIEDGSGAVDPDDELALKAIPIMSRQRRFLLRMGGFLLLVLALGGALVLPLREAFMANPALNGLIGGVLMIGIIYTFRQVLMLGPEVTWLEQFQRSNEGGLRIAQEPPALLAPMAVMLREQQGKMALSAVSTRSILDSVFTRLDESRDISRYMIGLLVFLGLLGTFWGLLGTIGSIGATIQSLSVDGGAGGAEIFDALKRGLEAPLAGMGTAFSSSLFGLGGSLVLGFLDLSAAQAQNRFYNELEEWLSGQTQLTTPGGVVAAGEVDYGAPAYLTALVEQTADTVEQLQKIVARNEENRAAGNNAIIRLSEQLAGLTDRLEAEHVILRRLAEGRQDLRPLLEALVERQTGMDSALDAASQQHLRNIDVHLLRLLEESAEGRERAINELRAEIKLLTRTISTLTQERQGS